MTSLPPPVTVGDFEGPLDLLLEEVREQKIAIEDLRMGPLVARFLDYVRGARERNFNLDIEWLLLAATLIQWKSRSLLPPDPAQPANTDPVRDELIRQLLAHKRELAEELGRRKKVAEASFSRAVPDRAAVEESPTPDDLPDLPFLSVWDLTQQARELARWAADYRATLAYLNRTFDVEPEPVTVADMSHWLRQTLAQATTLPVDALPLLEQQPTPAHRGALFLGLLELVRDQVITVEQKASWEKIWIAE